MSRQLKPLSKGLTRGPAALPALGTPRTMGTSLWLGFKSFHSVFKLLIGAIITRTWWNASKTSTSNIREVQKSLFGCISGEMLHCLDGFSLSYVETL